MTALIIWHNVPFITWSSSTIWFSYWMSPVLFSTQACSSSIRNRRFEYIIHRCNEPLCTLDLMPLHVDTMIHECWNHVLRYLVDNIVSHTSWWLYNDESKSDYVTIYTILMIALMDSSYSMIATATPISFKRCISRYYTGVLLHFCSDMLSWLLSQGTSMVTMSI